MKKKTTLEIKKDNYTDKQWMWLVNNWENMTSLGKQMLEENIEEADDVLLNIQTSKLIEISHKMFDTNQDYVEFTNITTEIIQNEIIKWFYKTSHLRNED